MLFPQFPGKEAAGVGRKSNCLVSEKKHWETEGKEALENNILRWRNE